MKHFLKTCAVHHMTFGGLCLNCGASPTNQPEKTSPSWNPEIFNKAIHHEWDARGFCKWCHNTHRTDFRPNDICSFLKKNLDSGAVA